MSSSPSGITCQAALQKGQLPSVWVVIVAALLGGAGCAQTKSVDPIPMSQQGDQDLTCVQINQQIYTDQVAGSKFRKSG